MEKLIKLEKVLKFVSEDLGEEAKVVELPFSSSRIKVIVKENVNPVKSYFDDEEGIVILNDNGKDVMEDVYCLLYEDDFVDSEMTLISLEGAKNGCLVLLNLEQFATEDLLALT